MKVQQISLSQDTWKTDLENLNIPANLFLLFVSIGFNDKEALLDTLSGGYPDAIIVGCSTAGEINDVQVVDNTVSLSAVQMEKVQLRSESVILDDMKNSYKTGQELAKKLHADNLSHSFILSDGLNVNGADLVSGLKSVITNTSITGGLAGDAGAFKETFVIDGGEMKDKTVVGVGFYGDQLKVGHSSKGGWDSFGIERLVTKSEKNILYELDGKPALELYKSFLGEEAANLPSSGLLFPLSMRLNESSKPLVRTILGINEEDQSLTFAGNINQGSYVRLMKANVDRLINGAENSAILAAESIQEEAELAILISCVGRRLVLKQLIEEEVEAVRFVLGHKPKITGFYSYGEIAPHGEFSSCELHNQTMTITTLSEC
ncbi:MAG: hypothetical protein HKN96_12550 [Flavobacteriaceae bacterium]|nr:FIST C-terminal domain-containing protein [Bacteroidia bacterium]NND12025.1 hypothetical protein [Flavobacteriaceae bacterium]NNL60607.1 hypothetical protein [Flavobacteriaceae bacterium]